jgi:hypothetical protein
MFGADGLCGNRQTNTWNPNVAWFGGIGGLEGRVACRASVEGGRSVLVNAWGGAIVGLRRDGEFLACARDMRAVIITLQA